MLWHVLNHSFRGALHNELGHYSAFHGHDRRNREISLVLGADEVHPSVLLRSRPAAVPQAQELRGRLVHVHDARGVHFVLRHEVRQAQSELVHVHVHQLGVLRCLRDVAQQPQSGLIGDRNRMPRERQEEDCLARFTRRTSSSPALLALLPLRERVLRERPAPLRLDA